MAQTIDFPTFRECYGLYGNSDITVTEFIDRIDFRQTLILDPNYYNIVLHGSTKEITKNIDLIKELSNGKEVKIYKMANDVMLPCVEHTFSVLDYLTVVGNFDLFILFTSTCGYKIVKMFNFYKTLTLTSLLYSEKISSKLSKTNQSNQSTKIDENLSLIEYQEINSKDVKYVFYDCDIKLSELDCNPRSNVVKSLNKAIKNYLASIKLKIEIQNSEMTNILVLCANNITIKRQSYRNIVKYLLGKDVTFDDVDTYYVGVDIGINKEPFVNRGYINNIECEGKFDVILSEHCPDSAFNENLELLKSLLKDDGMIIIPDYTRKNVEGLRMVINKNRYIGYMKE